jgi:apolipoprotein N-acyltransferase
MTRQLWGHDLIIWPEVAIPGRQEDMQEDFLDPMAVAAKANQAHILTGIVVSNWLKREYYNSMLLLGSQQGVYHKRHLVPFGEFMPLRGLLDFMRSYIHIPMADMKPGASRQQAIELNGVRLGISICYEDVFSRDINLDLPAAHLLVNASNDAWFGDSLAPHQHLEIARMRALETGRPMVRSTNTGRSALIDHRGQITSVTGQFVEQTLGGTVEGRTGATPFIGFARLQPYLAGLIVLIASSLVLRHRKR